jgi:hypothetical protein
VPERVERVGAQTSDRRDDAIQRPRGRGGSVRHGRGPYLESQDRNPDRTDFPCPRRPRAIVGIGRANSNRADAVRARRARTPRRAVPGFSVRGSPSRAVESRKCCVVPQTWDPGTRVALPREATRITPMPFLLALFSLAACDGTQTTAPTTAEAAVAEPAAPKSTENADADARRLHDAARGVRRGDPAGLPGRVEEEDGPGREVRGQLPGLGRAGASREGRPRGRRRRALARARRAGPRGRRSHHARLALDVERRDRHALDRRHRRPSRQTRRASRTGPISRSPASRCSRRT